MNVKYFILRILRKLRILTYLNVVLSTKLSKNKFRIPVFHGIGLDHFSPSEKWMANLIEQLLTAKKGQFVDVGVNIGQTLLKLKSVNPAVAYTGFEPNPMCVYYVNQLNRLNEFEGVSIIPCGIYSFDGIAQLFIDKNNTIDSCATLVKEFREVKDQERIVVPVISGDSLVFLNGEISILKIDVEGAEVEVIEAFKSIISSKRPFVVCEILPAYSTENSFRLERQQRIETLFLQMNYKIAHIRDQLVPIEGIPLSNDVNDSNYLFYPTEDESILNVRGGKN